jgi:hypothetical protein
MALFRGFPIVLSLVMALGCGANAASSAAGSATTPRQISGAATSGNAISGAAANGGHPASNSFATPANPPQDGQLQTSAGEPARKPAPDEPKSVGRYEVIELAFPYASGALANPWEDVAVTAAFRTPAGRLIMVEGFFYDEDTYLVRFVPTELGEYEYTVDLRGPSGNDSYAGSFTSAPSQRKGFLRKQAGNPYRLVFDDDGSIANVVGLQDCWAKTGELTGFIEEKQKVDLETYLKTYGAEGAGFNLLRWNPGNCGFDIYDKLGPKGNTYFVRESKWADRLLTAARAHGFHIMLALFFKPPDASQPDQYLRAARYVMARYGAYVDVWEITNETEAEKFPIEFIQALASYVRALDPYKRLITNSFERDGDWKVLDARSPHIQISQDAFADMQRATQGFTTAAAVISGETYNPGNRNWDELSSRRLRMYAWTAFLTGLVDVYWNTTFSRTCKCVPGNMYLGAEERGYIAVLQKLSAGVPANSELLALQLPDKVTGYALTSPTTFLAYLYRPLGTTVKTTSQFGVDVPVNGTLTFFDPATGNSLGHFPVKAGKQLFKTPPYVQDVVISIR